MTESTRMANAPLTKLLPETVRPFKFISVTPDTVTVDKNWIPNTVSVDSVTRTCGNTKRKDGTGQDNEMPYGNFHTLEDETDKMVHAEVGSLYCSA